MRSRGATHNAIAIAVALVCAGALAQTGGNSKASTSAERNLQVENAAASAINNTQRIALVIGNSAYKEAPLANPVNDERAIVQALKESGFTVIVRENADQPAMLSALREFGDHLRAGGTGLFYYAGHGMQIKGRNYLIPVGASIEREDEVAFSAIDAQAVLDKMEAAGNPTNIMILDACRNNPFTRSTRSGQAGLAQMDAPVGTLVAYATSPGAVASDGGGANGLYTQYLLAAIRQPGNKIEDVFKQVRANVRRDSQGKQVPWESTSLEGDFYFKGGPVVIITVDASVALEAALWDAVKGSSLAVEVRAYLSRYPNGRFVPDAQARLAQLELAASASAKAQANQKAAAERATLEAQIKANADQAATEASRKAAAELAAAESKRKAASERAIAEAKAQAGMKKREDTLRVSLAAAASPAPSPVARPVRASNSAGFTVGDRWRYQTVDKFKKEVVSNWSRTVEAINSDGTLKVNGGNIEWTGDGAVKAMHGPDGFLREYSPSFKTVPRTLEVGYSEPVKQTLIWGNTNGNRGTEEHEGTIAVISKEVIKVPAGEFEAWKIELSITVTGKYSNKSGVYFYHYKEMNWYVPSLHNFVAQEIESRTSRELLRFERNELSSYSVRGADSLAQK
jgi:uncharacterized caspase-like protein